MSNLKNRKSVMALVLETNEGEPKAPTLGSEYVALQEGFDFNPQFSELESAELQDSIGQAKTILGTESPTMSFSHYLKHSGVEGKAPSFGIVLHSLLGMKTLNLTEEEAEAGSTTEVIKVDAPVVTPEVKATANIQDLRFDSKLDGSLGNAITIEYIAGGTAGAEVVTVLANAITVEIEDGVSTAVQIKTAVEADLDANALVLITLLGAGTETQAIQAETSLVGGVTEVKDASLIFRKGQALLIKDAVNGYSIRNILDIQNDSLILAFVTPVSTPVGTKLGMAVHYEGVSEGHPSLSVWGFRANGGAVELISGGKVTDMSVDITAGELINSSFNIAGTTYFFDPIEIKASTKFLDLDDNGTVRVVQIPEGFYKDPHDVAEKLQQNLNALGGSVFTVRYSDSSGKFTITSPNTLSLLLNTGANVLNSIAPVLGFTNDADLTGSLAYTGDNAISLAAPQAPVYDQSNPIVAKANEVLFGDKDQIACFKARSVNFSIANEQERIPDLCADSGFEGTENTSRSATVDIVATLSQYDADKYKKFRKGDTVSFAYNLGEKIGGDWVGGKCVNLFMPYATITSFKIGDANGIATLEMSVRAYVESGNSEVHVNCI